MTDLKKMAAEYSVVGLAAGTSAIHRRAYMAGAKAALEVAAAKVRHDCPACSGTGHNGPDAECEYCGRPMVSIRSLLPEVST